MHKHPQQAKQQEAYYKETQQITFIGYSINYYTALIRYAVSFVNDIKLLHEIANRLLDSLDNETRERILNELSFLTRRRDVDEVMLQMLINELAKLLSPLIVALKKRNKSISIKSVVELLPVLDIVMLMYSDDSDVVNYATKLEEVVLKIVETLELYVKYDSPSRLSYYSSIKDALRDYEIKVTESDSTQNSTQEVEKVAKVVKKFFRIRIGKRYVAYWGALLSARIKRSGINYVDDFDTILKLLPHDEYYVTLMPMLLHYGVSDPSELPKSLKNEIVKYVNYWLAD